MKVLYSKPIKTVGVALFAGIILGLSAKRMSRAVIPGAGLAAIILKKLI